MEYRITETMLCTVIFSQEGILVDFIQRISTYEFKIVWNITCQISQL